VLSNEKRAPPLLLPLLLLLPPPLLLLPLHLHLFLLLHQPLLPLLSRLLLFLRVLRPLRPLRPLCPLRLLPRSQLRLHPFLWQFPLPPQPSIAYAQTPAIPHTSLPKYTLALPPMQKATTRAKHTRVVVEQAVRGAHHTLPVYTTLPGNLLAS
jgi:hypothetical protein